MDHNGLQWITMDFKADRSDPNLAIQCNKYRRYTIGRFVMGVGEEGVMASPNIFKKNESFNFLHSGKQGEYIPKSLKQ